MHVTVIVKLLSHVAPTSPLDFPDKNTGVGCHFLFQLLAK